MEKDNFKVKAILQLVFFLYVANIDGIMKLFKRKEIINKHKKLHFVLFCLFKSKKSY